MQQNWKFRRGDIYYVQFGNTSTGSEQHGDRPAVIIQNDVGNTYAPTLIVVPLTSNGQPGKAARMEEIRFPHLCGVQRQIP